MSYYREHGIPVKIIRIFNTYGPKMNINDGRVVSNFIVQALRGDNITIYGDGRQSRSFQYIDDLIEGMVRMMDDTPDEFTIAELAREVISLTGSKSKIVHLPLPADDPQQRQPDISLARNMLGGWEPKIQLRDGLLKTIAYFEEVLSRGGIRR
jgi:UDP-glucuronate decarboxylase